MALLCRKYSLNPLQNIDGHFQLDPARRTDPIGGLKEVGKDWDSFLKDVNNKKNSLSVLLQIIKLKLSKNELSY
jgi:N-acetyl-anhydromuramyl-L-alanine amidase AmpD